MCTAAIPTDGLPSSMDLSKSKNTVRLTCKRTHPVGRVKAGRCQCRRIRAHPITVTTVPATQSVACQRSKASVASVSGLEDASARLANLPTVAVDGVSAHWAKENANFPSNVQKTTHVCWQPHKRRTCPNRRHNRNRRHKGHCHIQVRQGRNH